MMILAILKFEWNLNYAEEATIAIVGALHVYTSSQWSSCELMLRLMLCHLQVVFFGFVLGSAVWAVIADKYGRKTVVFIMNHGGGY